jgi:hypothetical protein
MQIAQMEYTGIIQLYVEFWCITCTEWLHLLLLDMYLGSIFHTVYVRSETIVAFG